MDESLKNAIASLVAATYLLRRAYETKKPPNKLFPSDRMFEQALRDYDSALERAQEYWISQCPEEPSS